MPFVLRIIQKNRWEQQIDPDTYYLTAPADILNDWKTKGNTISVWMVENDEADITRLVTALAAKREKLDPIDYLLFDSQVLADCSISQQRTPGDTPDSTVNSWHCDLVGLSVSGLANLVEKAWEDGIRKRVLKKEVRVNILNALQSECLSIDRLADTLKTLLK